MNELNVQLYRSKDIVVGVVNDALRPSDMSGITSTVAYLMQTTGIDRLSADKDGTQIFFAKKYKDEYDALHAVKELII